MTSWVVATPPDRNVLAVEPSSVMITHRLANAAPVVRAVAEALPLADDRVDAVMAVLSDHLRVIVVRASVCFVGLPGVALCCSTPIPLPAGGSG